MGKIACSEANRATRILWKWLNRRSQRRSMNWERFQPHDHVQVALDVENADGYTVGGLFEP
jgi:hypothetical protein